MKHLPNETFVFLTDDKENRRLALEEKIPAFSGSHVNCFSIIAPLSFSFLVEEYVKHLEDGELLADKLAKQDFDAVVDAKNLFPNHLPFSEIHARIQQKSLYQGTFKASRDNFLEGYVNVESFDDPVKPSAHFCVL